MTLTNVMNLPETFVRAVKSHEHKAGNYSASMLGNSARQVWLKRRHEDGIVEDVSDRVWSLLGTAVHYILEKGEGEHELSEQFLEQEILPGVTISGMSDLYNGAKRAVDDYKTTSVWTIIYRSRIKEWTEQLNVYAWLYRMAGFTVEQLRIVAILRDWSKGKAKAGGNYPRVPVVTVPIKLWTIEEQLAHIRNRIAYFESFRDTPDDQLPFCTPEERWEESTKFAVKRAGRKSAVKVCDSEAAAQEFMSANGFAFGYSIERRTGYPKRCDDYCPVSQFCSQRQLELRQGPAETMGLEADKSELEGVRAAAELFGPELLQGGRN